MTLLRQGAAPLFALVLACSPGSAQSTSFVQSKWVPMSGDPGRGLVVFRSEPGVTHFADTLPFFEAPQPEGSARPVALWIRQSDRGEDVQHFIAGLASVLPNLLEYGYEVPGLPFDSLSGDSRWARVLLGLGADRQMQRAWVALDTNQVRFFWWGPYLAEREGVFLVAPSAARFALSPNGQPIRSPLSPTFRAEDHWLEILGREGDWLKVRLTQPADLCGADPTPGAIALEAWVRFLAPNGRPLVWYYTRGC